MSEGNEVEVNAATAEVATMHDRFAQYLQARAEVEADIVAKQLSESQLSAILTATTPEELDTAMEMAGLIGLRMLDDGAEIQINTFHVAPGNRPEYANSLGVWAVMEVQLLENGQQINLDTGVERVIGFLRMCEQMDRFPVQCHISKIGTGSGNEMITLLPLRKRAVQGSAE